MSDLHFLFHSTTTVLLVILITKYSVVVLRHPKAVRITLIAAICVLGLNLISLLNRFELVEALIRAISVVCMWVFMGYLHARVSIYLDARASRKR